MPQMCSRNTQAMNSRLITRTGTGPLQNGVSTTNKDIIYTYNAAKLILYALKYTVEPLNKGHLGIQVVVPYSEVCVKTVLLCTNIASVIDNEV